MHFLTLFLVLSASPSNSLPSKPMSETRTLTAAGLWTNPNELSGRPPGALSEADNVEVERPGVLRPARGQYLNTEPYNETDSRLSSGIAYSGVDFEHTTAGELVRYEDGQPLNVVDAATDESASIEAPSGARVRFVTAEGDLYLTSSTGPRVIDGGSNVTSAELAVPGVPHALDFFGAQWAGGGHGGGGTPGGTGFLAPENVVAYRAVIGVNDAEGKPQLGAPSGRLLVANPLHTVLLTRASNVTTLTFPTPVDLFTGDLISVTPTNTNNPAPALKTVTAVGGSGGFAVRYNETGPNVAVGEEYTVSLLTRPTYMRLPLPPGLPTGRSFIQIYRSAQVPIATQGGPGDDMRLVIERPLTDDEINGVAYGYPEIEATDITPDALRGVPLYTNALQEGLGQANNRPPAVADIAFFKQSLIGVDVTRARRLLVRFIATPDVGDVLTLDGLGYEVTDTGVVGTDGTWDVVDDDTYTPSQQIELTAKNFIKAVNYRASQDTVRAYYVSGVDDPPGMVLIEALEVDVGAPEFTLQADGNGDRYVPDLSAPISSVAERIPHGVIMSKPGLPYAFPPASQHLLRLGAAEKPNVRGIALRDSFWIFKSAGGPGGGVWKITGSGPGAFYPEQVTASVYLVAPESAVVIGNTIYALTNLGVTAFSDGGIDVISAPIDNQFQQLLRQEMLATVYEHAVGVAYEVGTESKYMLFMPESPGASHATLGFTFNTNADIQAWTRRTDDLGAATGAYVNAEGKLVTGYPDSPVVAVERKESNRFDFRGQNETVLHLTNNVSGSRFVADDVTGIQVGYTIWLYDGTRSTGSAIARVTAVSEDNWIEVDSAAALRAAFTGGEQDFWAVDTIPIRFGWNVDSASAPNAPKDFLEQTLQFDEAHTLPWTFEWRTDLGGYATMDAYPEGRKYLHQWVSSDVAYCTRLNTSWQYYVGAEEVNVLGFTSVMTVYPDASTEM
jgi:hypothetical protein